MFTSMTSNADEGDASGGQQLAGNLATAVNSQKQSGTSATGRRLSEAEVAAATAALAHKRVVSSLTSLVVERRPGQQRRSSYQAASWCPIKRGCCTRRSRCHRLESGDALTTGMLTSAASSGLVDGADTELVSGIGSMLAANAVVTTKLKKDVGCKLPTQHPRMRRRPPPSSAQESASVNRQTGRCRCWWASRWRGAEDSRCR